jgi:hypothetical protein
VRCLVSGIVRKSSKATVWPGDVLTLTSWTGHGPVLQIRVSVIADGRIWGRECNAKGETFGLLMAFRPEDVGCEVSSP